MVITPSSSSYDEVKKSIQNLLHHPTWDDGSLGPLLVRLAWHASGTYDRVTGTGGSDGATMRFAPESSDSANAGLEHARKFLEPIKQKYPWISYADLWTLAGAVAIEAMGGPKIPWSAGRVDKPATVSTSEIPPNGRLPDASQGAAHVREVFYRMGFNDREITALIGAHALGRCHPNRSGYDGPWTYTPTRFSNQYYKLLLNTEWIKKKWSGPEQFVSKDGELMMLPADMVFKTDPTFLKYTRLYANDKEVFYQDFATAFGKLLALGVKKKNKL